MKRDVVAIGASLGGPRAVQQLLAALPADFPAMVFLVLHVGAEGKNFFADILDSQAGMTVTTAIDGEKPQRGHAYVAPADHHLLIVDGLIRLGRGPRENMSRPAVDPLFRSVGVTYGPRAIAVVLTGMLNDGAAGLADVKRCGGVTVVQNPTDAFAPSMPRSALYSTDVDYRASLAELPQLLTTLTGEEAGAAPVVSDSIAAEVAIALGRNSDAAVISKIARPSTLSCPTCHGVLSEITRSPLRFRCQVGHGFTGEVLDSEDNCHLEEAIRMALRIVDERLVLFRKLSEDAAASGASKAARSYEERSAEVRGFAEVLKKALHRNDGAAESSSAAA